MIDIAPEPDSPRPRIAVIGVGGGGGNAVAGMIQDDPPGVDFAVANTDAQALLASPAGRLLQLGRKATGGLGAGADPEVGRAAAEESTPEVEALLEGTRMCFIAAGLGGGTGTGAAPVIARAARAMGILTVGVVTLPFAFEGARRARIAAAGVEALRAEADTLIVVPNQNLFRIAGPDTRVRDAFALADAVLQQGVRAITDLMVLPGLINLDFADVRAVMAGGGRATMGTCEAAGEGRALRAAEAAIANPLLDDAVRGASGLLVSITGGEDLRLMEVDEAVCRIRDEADGEAEIIWGSAFDPELQGRIRISVIATGLDRAAAVAAEVAQAQPEKPMLFAAPASGPSLFDRMARPAPARQGAFASLH